MNEVGIVVSFNSDSDELARRMNIEAAKGIKYGGMKPTDALKLVTINPAIQLGIEHRTGSIEIGKDADIVIWNGNPLSTYSVCEQTWIEGRKYFDIVEDKKLISRDNELRNKLIQKALLSDQEHETKSVGQKKKLYHEHSCGVEVIR